MRRNYRKFKLIYDQETVLPASRFGARKCEPFGRKSVVSQQVGSSPPAAAQEDTG
jgi:hypothetical protein